MLEVINCGIFPCFRYWHSHTVERKYILTYTQTHNDQVAFSVGGSHCKWQLVTERHTPEVPFRTDVQKAHTHTLTHIQTYRHTHIPAPFLYNIYTCILLHRHTQHHKQKRTHRRRAQTPWRTRTRHDGTWQSDMECVSRWSSIVMLSINLVIAVLLEEKRHKKWAVSLPACMQMVSSDVSILTLNQTSGMCSVLPLSHLQDRYQLVTLPNSVLLRHHHSRKSQVR